MRRTSGTRTGQVIRGILGAAALAALAAMAAPVEAAGDRVRPVPVPEGLGTADAAALARRVAAIEAELTAIWRLDLRRQGRAYAKPQIVTFAGRRFGACGGAIGVTGVSYCAADRTLSVDLAVLAQLAERLGAAAETGTALLLAYGTAVHVQAELAILGDAERLRHARAPQDRDALDREVALQADCLTGVWASRAEAALGPVKPAGWRALVETVRTLAPEAAASARLDLYSAAEREEAFAHGLEAGAITGCLTPELSGLLG